VIESVDGRIIDVDEAYNAGLVETDDF